MSSENSSSIIKKLENSNQLSIILRSNSSDYRSISLKDLFELKIKIDMPVDITAAENVFIAEDEIVTVISLFDHPVLNLISVSNHILS